MFSLLKFLDHIDGPLSFVHDGVAGSLLLFLALNRQISMNARGHCELFTKIMQTYRLHQCMIVEYVSHFIDDCLG